MTVEAHREFARQFLSLFPKTAIKRLALDPEFREQLQLRTSATIRFQGCEVPFERNSILEAVSCVYRAGSNPEVVTDVEGNEWQLSFSPEADWPILSRNGLQIPLPMLWCISKEDTIRIGWMERLFRENRAAGTDFDRWRERLAQGPIHFEDVDALMKDIQRTPTQITLALRRSLQAGSASPDVLTPEGYLYYERLVGARGDAATLSEFVQGPAKEHAAALLEWDPEVGLKQSLLSGSHSGLVPDLPADFSLAVLERVVEWAARQGDRVSQVAAFELALHYLRDCPTLIDGLVSIAQQIRDDDPDDEGGRLRLLSNLFVFVDGSLARMGYLRQVPPYWRRLAALAQASLIEREFIAGGVTTSVTNDWAQAGRGSIFFLQSSIDGRLEPRWIPDLATTEQWKRELVSRIVGAAERDPDAIKGTPLEPLIRSEEPGSLRSQFEFPFSFVPGPLEGGLDAMIDTPAELEQVMRESVTVGTTNPAAFNALVNACLVFRTPPELAQQAAEAIKAAKYRVRENTDGSRNFAMLSGLALVAAVTRSSDLARELRILTRVALRRVGSSLGPMDSFRIAIVAANAFDELGEWRNFLGEWITEISFSELTKSDAVRLHEFVLSLCDLEPALWATLARADAALGAYTNAI